MTSQWTHWGSTWGCAKIRPFKKGHILENYGKLRRCGSKNIKSLKFWCIPIWFMNYQDYHYQEMVPGFMKLHLALIFTIQNFCNLFFFCTTWRDQADLAPGLRVYVGSEKDATAFYAGSMTAFMLLLAQHGRNRSGGVKRQRDTKWCYMRFKTLVDDYGGLY